MANLETLELRISANAQEATKGLGKLICSLLNLQRVLPGVTGDLQKFNDQLRTLKGFKNMSFDGLAKSVKSAKKVIETTDAVKKQTSAVNNLVQAMKPVDSATTTVTGKTEEVVQQTDALNDQTQQIKNNVNGIVVAARNLGQSSADVNKLSSSFSKMLTSVSRIAKTMLIRTAIRAVIKGAKEGLDNFYQYAKKIGNGYASQIDQVSSKWKQLKNQMGATIGTALAAVMPILSAITNLALAAFNALSALFAMLNGKDTYSQATYNVEEYSDSVSGATKATRELLASFDELNVIQSQGTGGGGGGAINYGELFQEVEVPQWLIEWGPVIKAILGGVLAATILPGIVDWVKKIFGLFGGDDALNALKFLTKLFGDDNTGGTLPDIGDAATQMVTFGAGAAAAAAALPIIVEQMTLLKELFEGFSLLETIITTLLELLTKAVAGGTGTVKVEVDDQEVKDWNEEFKGTTWDKDVEINVNIDKEDFIETLIGWTEEDSTKTVSVSVDMNNVDLVTKLTMWTGEDSEKKINVTVDMDNIDLVTKLTMWTGEDSTKTISVSVEMDNIDLVTRLTLWTAEDSEKKINVKVDMNNIDLVTKLTMWTAQDSDKLVNLKFVDNGEVLGHLMEWVDTESTKVINVEIKNNGSSGDGGDSGGGGKSFWDQIFGQPVWETFNEWLGLENKPFWDVINDWISGGEKKPVEVKYGDVVKVIDDQNFKDSVSKMLADNVKGILSADNISKLKKDFPNLSASDIFVISDFAHLTSEAQKELTTNLITSFTSEEAITSIKEAIPNISADGLVNLTDWDKMTDNEQKEFIKEMQKVFGAEDTKKAMEKLGVDVSKDIQTGIDSTDPTVKVGAEWEDAKDPKTIFEKAAENLKAKAKIAAQFTWAKNKDMETVVTKKVKNINKDGNRPVIKGGYDFKKGCAPEDIKTKIQNDCKPTVTVAATVEGGAAAKVGKAFADGVSNELNQKKFKVKFEGDTATIEAKANGGLVRSGDIFMANENGKSEMIGRFGSSTAVANQEQMVEAMARGVSYAQAEQNSLLREQNRLLLGILQKEGTVNIGASSALGRTVRQSLNMYDSLVGG